VQLYIHQRAARVAQPVRELKGFQRVHLAAGESGEVKFTLRAEDVIFHDTEGRSIIEPGEFDVWIAPDSTSGLQTSIVLE